MKDKHMDILCFILFIAGIMLYCMALFNDDWRKAAHDILNSIHTNR